MISLRSFIAIFVVVCMMSGIGAAYLWHRTVLRQAVTAAERRGQRMAAASLRQKRKVEIGVLKQQAAEDQARARYDGVLRKDLMNVQSIDDNCRVPGDALRLLDSIGTDPPSAP